VCENQSSDISEKKRKLEIQYDYHYTAKHLCYKSWQDNFMADKSFHKIIRTEVSKPFQQFRLYPISNYSIGNVRPTSEFFSQSSDVKSVREILVYVTEKATAVTIHTVYYRRYSSMTVKKWRGQCPVRPHTDKKWEGQNSRTPTGSSLLKITT